MELARIERPFDGNIEIIDGVSEEEITRLLCVNEEILKIDKFNHNIKDFEFAFHFFAQFFQDFANQQPIEEFSEHSYRIKIFLNSAYEYIDTTRKVLSTIYPDKVRRNKKDGKMVAEGTTRFDFVASKLFDDYFEYRFCYNFRSYVQHVGVDGANYERENGKNSITIMSKEFLLNYPDMNGVLRAELEAAENFKIDIVKNLFLYGQYIKSMHGIISCNCYDVFILKSFDLACQLIELFKRKGLSLDNEYILVDFKDTAVAKAEIKINSLNVRLAKAFIDQYCKVCREDDGDDGCDSKQKDEYTPLTNIVDENGLVWHLYNTWEEHTDIKRNAYVYFPEGFPSAIADEIFKIRIRYMI